MLGEFLPEVKAVKALKAGKIVDLVGIQDLPSAHKVFFYQKRFELRPLGVYRSRHSRRPRADNDYIVNPVHFLSFPNPRRTAQLVRFGRSFIFQPVHRNIISHFIFFTSLLQDVTYA